MKIRPELRALAPAIACDLAACGGVASIVHGVSLVYGPAGWIAAGALVLAGAWTWARRP